MIVMLTIPGEPAVKQRPRCGRRVRSAPGQQAAEDAIAREFQARYIVPEAYTGPVHLGVQFNTRSASKDIDNMLKIVMDALSGVLWRDDRQVIAATAWVKREADEPSTRIHVYLDDDGSVIER